MYRKNAIPSYLARCIDGRPSTDCICHSSHTSFSPGSAAVNHQSQEPCDWQIVIAADSREAARTITFMYTETTELSFEQSAGEDGGE